MAGIETKSKDILWGYVGQFLNVGVNFLLIPISIKILPPETYGVWQLFVTIYLFLNLMDFGFRPTFIRNIAYVYSGSVSLEKKGLRTERLLDEPNYSLLKSLTLFMKSFYGWFSMAMFILAISLGSWYIHDLTKDLPDYNTIIIAWILYVSAISLSSYILYYTTLLNGCGFIQQSYKITAFSKIAYFLITAILLYSDFGLASFGWGMFISTIFNLIFAVYFVRKVGLFRELKKAVETKIDVFSIVSHNAMRVGIVNFSLFFTTRGSLFLASFFLSLKIIGEYGLTLQFIGIMALVGQIYLQTNIPQISAYRINNNMIGISRIIGEVYVISICVYLISGLILLLYGNTILGFIGSKTYLIDTIPLALLLVVYLLDMNHNIAIQIITTRNEVPHLWACIITGFFITILTYLLLKYTNWGIYSIIVCIGVVQLVYQNWKWPNNVSKELNTTYLNLFRMGTISLIKKISFK